MIEKPRLANYFDEFCSLQKHRRYKQAAEDVRGSFTSLMCSDEEISLKNMEYSRKRISETLPVEWNKPFSQMIKWMLIQWQLCIIKYILTPLKTIQWEPSWCILPVQVSKAS